MSSTILGFLMDGAIKGSVLLAAAWLLTALMRDRSAAGRHFVWLIGVLAFIALPIISTIGPRFELPIESARAVVSVESVLQRVIARDSTGSAMASISTRDAAAQPEAGAARTNSNPQSTRRMTVAQALLSAYLLGGGLLLARFAGLLWRVRRRLGTLEPFEDSRAGEALRALREELGVARPVELLSSESDSSPWTWGVFRPRLVLPDSFSSWPETAQRSVLLHELSHIARHDHLVATLLQCCCALHWFNPLVWLAARRIRLEAEQACDDRVLTAGVPPAAYAEQLLSIANRVFEVRGHSVWVLAMVYHPSLSARVTSILDTNRRRLVMSRPKKFLTSALAFAVVAPLATIESQETVPSLGDPVFIEILSRGPSGSTELERIVDTYVANGMRTEAADVMARFMMREYGTADDHGCDFCIAILSSDGTPAQHEHLPVLIEAMDLIEQRAAGERSGNRLLQTVLSTFVGSGNRRNMEHATYYVMRAIQIGIDEEMHISVMNFLFRLGRLQEARDLAARLYDDESSMFYQTDTARQWLQYIESEIRRNELLTERIVNSLEVDSLADETTEYEYAPIVKTPPEYPPEAASRGLEGHVVVEFTVNTEGKTQDLFVYDSSDGVFEEAALVAARQFRYAPRFVAGTAVSVPGVRNRITFVLEQ